ncbi:MAG: hypothetical protein JWP36_2629, partial [Paucimonas sp.]|nr:hypothetical protein [Paucimonas sp.]
MSARRRKRRTELARREFFKRSGGLLLGLGMSAWLPACGGSDPITQPAAAATGGGGSQPGSPFQHGVASGDPLADRVLLWTRVTTDPTQTVPVDVTVCRDPGMADVVFQARTSTDATRDHTVKIDATNLQPATTYYYRFSALGVRSPVGRTRTLPRGQTNRLRIAVVSCASLAQGFFNAYSRIAERADLDLVVHLGDYIYESAPGDFGNVRPYEPARETLTLADYRTRYAQYRRDADLQAVHRQHPMVAIWDDHEFADNAWSGGATNHTPGAEGDWTARVAAAVQAWYEWMPARVADATDLRRNNRSFSLGDLADLVMLEERVVARSQQLKGNAQFATFTGTDASADPTRTLLGTAEEDWLATRLKTSTAKWKLVGQGVMFAQLKLTPGRNADGGGVFVNPDQWDGYQPARDRVYSMLANGAGGAAVSNVVFLTGDLHSSWAADLTPDPNNPDVASGGYDAASGAGSRAVEFVATS